MKLPVHLADMCGAAAKACGGSRTHVTFGYAASGTCPQQPRDSHSHISSGCRLLTFRRKSPAWFGLQRKHAELAVADVAYLDVMRDNCKARTMINHK